MLETKFFAKAEGYSLPLTCFVAHMWLHNCPFAGGRTTVARAMGKPFPPFKSRQVYTYFVRGRGHPIDAKTFTEAQLKFDWLWHCMIDL